MKTFISWSGAQSKAIAEELRDWLPTIVQSLDPFLSTHDIPIGGRGLNVLASELEQSCFGILCLTRQNRQQPWVIFEAGALSKVIDVGRVVPLLLDLKPSDLTGPLAQFQSVVATNREDVFAMIKALAETSAPPVITEESLRRLFSLFWPEFEGRIAQVIESGTEQPHQETRTQREILEEVLALSRRTERELTRVAQMQVAESVMESRSRASGKRNEPPWWGPFIRTAVGDVLTRIRPLGANVRSFTTDDTGLHIFIDGGSAGRTELCDQLQASVAEHSIPIHVRGEPIGDETFEALERGGPE